MLEFALEMWDNAATMRRAVSPLHNSRTVSLLLRALKNAIDASAKSHAIELVQRLVAHPSMLHQTVRPYPEPLPKAWFRSPP
jgi:hypothetical protein